MKTGKQTLKLGALAALVMVLAAALFTGCPQPASNLAAISSFIFPAADNDALSADVTAAITDTAITATVPHGTDVTALAATAEASAGATISPDPATAADYTSPVTFTVTAEDGETTAAYTVTVTVAPADDPTPSADTTAPTPGALSVRSVGLEAVMMEWTAATDAVTAAGNLEYRLYYSATDNISSAADAETNGTPVGSGYAAGITTATATGLAQTTSYYFTVVVQDEAENKAAFAPVQQGTRVSVIENDVTAGSDSITAVAVEGPYVFLAGYERDGTDDDWRIEKRDLATGALVTGFGTDGVIQDGLDNNDQPTSMAIWEDYLIVSGWDNSQSNNQWRTRIYDKNDGSLVMGKVSNPTAGNDVLEAVLVDGEFLYSGGEQYTASNDTGLRLEKRSMSTLDLASGFAAGGVYTDDPYAGWSDIYYALAADDTCIYAAGGIQAAMFANACIDKFDKSTGVKDSSFGTGGRLEFGNTADYQEEIIKGITAAGGYLYVLVGYCDSNWSSEWDYLYLYRINSSDGSIDTSFAGGGDYILINPAGQQTLEDNPLVADDEYLYLITSTNLLDGADSQWYIEKRSLTSGETPALFNGGAPVSVNNSTGNGSDGCMEYPHAVVVDDLNILVGGLMYFDTSGQGWYLRILDKVAGE